MRREASFYVFNIVYVDKTSCFDGTRSTTNGCSILDHEPTSWYTHKGKLVAKGDIFEQKYVGSPSFHSLTSLQVGDGGGHIIARVNDDCL
jgi:hypothetical protein